MKEYILDKYDFKKYLLKNLEKTRQQDLIFWKNTIPMPVDVVYDMFAERGELFSLYLDHIGAACLLSYARKCEGGQWHQEIVGQPGKESRKKRNEFLELFKKYLASSPLPKLLDEMAGMLMLADYRPEEERFVEALCHNGKKYDRLYLPVKFRNLIDAWFPELLEYIAVRNNDMFSNVVADQLKIYRMGFADAFAGMFNKLVDFIIDNNDSGNTLSSNASSVKLIHLKVPPVAGLSISQDKVKDGSLWGISYGNSTNNYTLNASHPFYDWIKSGALSAEQVFAAMIECLASIEGGTFSPYDVKLLETHRVELSRRLRLKAEEKAT